MFPELFERLIPEQLVNRSFRACLRVHGLDNYGTVEARPWVSILVRRGR